MRELEDERPIPLGRARASAADGRAADSDAGGNRSSLGNGCPEAHEFLVDTGIHQEADCRPLTDGCPEDREVLVSTGRHQDANRGALTHGCPQPAEPSPVPRTAAHIERTRAQRDEPAPAVVEPPAAAVVPDVAAPIRPAGHAPGAHPMAALRRLRMEAKLVEPVHRPWRRILVNFAIAYVVVIGSVLGLIAAFLALTGNAGSAHP